MKRALPLVLALGCAQARPTGAATPVRAGETTSRPDEAATGRVDPAAIGRVIDDWHAAASRADEDRYFSYFAPGGVFLGTDATERWEVSAFRAYAHPYFAKGKAWTMVPSRRNIAVDGDHAWFDEALETSYGPCRGSGVLQRIGGAWKIAQYNLTLTIPNARVREVQKLLTQPH